ncbi:MAG: Hpt domain-containing protein [Planctomycetota bacterium]
MIGDGENPLLQDRAQPSGVPPVDMTRLMTLTAGFPEVLNEIIKIFIDDVESSVRAIETAIRNCDPNQVRKIAHSLKGASLNVGADTLAATAETLEKNAMAATATQLLSYSSQIKLDAVATTSFLKTVLNK